MRRIEMEDPLSPIPRAREPFYGTLPGRVRYFEHVVDAAAVRSTRGRHFPSDLTRSERVAIDHSARRKAPDSRLDAACHRPGVDG